VVSSEFRGGAVINLQDSWRLTRIERRAMISRINFYCLRNNSSFEKQSGLTH
jgi:hypothetical protein